MWLLRSWQYVIFPKCSTSRKSANLGWRRVIGAREARLMQSRHAKNDDDDGRERSWP